MAPGKYHPNPQQHTLQPIVTGAASEIPYYIMEGSPLLQQEVPYYIRKSLNIEGDPLHRPNGHPASLYLAGSSRKHVSTQPKSRLAPWRARFGAIYFTPEITTNHIHWKMLLKIHWSCLVQIHWTSDNTLDNTTDK